MLWLHTYSFPLILYIKYSALVCTVNMHMHVYQWCLIIRTDRFDDSVECAHVVGCKHSFLRPLLEAGVAVEHPVQRQAAHVLLLFIDFQHVCYLLPFHYILWYNELIDVYKGLNRIIVKVFVLSSVVGKNRWNFLMSPWMYACLCTCQCSLGRL